MPGMSDGILYKLYRDGTQEVALSQIDGDPLGGVNFVMIDRQERLWVSISTRELPYFPALVSPRSDGYIILIDDKGPRIVADGIMFTNEIRLDANEEYLYVVETLASRILRFPVHEDGSLGEREVFGPADLGYGGIPDGIAFDVEGNLWVAMIARNGLGIITQDGDYHVVFEDVNESGLDEVLTKLEAGTLAMEDVGALCGATLQLPTGIAFGGSDLKTVYMGSLAMPHLVTFESPVAGLPMRHWQ